MKRSVNMPRPVNETSCSHISNFAIWANNESNSFLSDFKLCNSLKYYIACNLPSLCKANISLKYNMLMIAYQYLNDFVLGVVFTTVYGGSDLNKPGVLF